MYDTDFFADLIDGSASSARKILPLLFEWIGTPHSVVDLGCGTGHWLAVCRRLGVPEVVGVDGDYVDSDLLAIDAREFLAAELTAPIDLNRTFGLAISLEVAEHLPEAVADTFVNTLARLAPTILFSAAVPLQYGRGHVNLQFQSYWARRFECHGFAAVDRLRRAVWRTDGVEPWYAQNTILYMRRVPQNLAPWVTRPKDLDMIHPDMFREELQSYGERESEMVRQMEEIRRLKNRLTEHEHELSTYRRSRLVRVVRHYWALRQKLPIHWDGGSF